MYKYNAEKSTVDIENLGECMQCEECTMCVKSMNHPEELLKVGLYEDQFLFTVESTGALPPEDIVTKAFNILIDKMSELSKLADEAEVAQDIN